MKEGDLVRYRDSYGKGWKTIRCWRYGFWDGVKVVCTDKEFTTIRKIEWLQKVIQVNIIYYLYIRIIYIPLSLIYRNARRFILIKTGKLLPIVTTK